MFSSRNSLCSPSSYFTCDSVPVCSAYPTCATCYSDETGSLCGDSGSFPSHSSSSPSLWWETILFLALDTGLAMLLLYLIGWGFDVGFTESTLVMIAGVILISYMIVGKRRRIDLQFWSENEEMLTGLKVDAV